MAESVHFKTLLMRNKLDPNVESVMSLIRVGTNCLATEQVIFIYTLQESDKCLYWKQPRR